ncbi:plasmid mobilization protein [Ahrensia kielensis]
MAVRLRSDEAEVIEQKAVALGMRAGAYIRQAALQTT